MTSGSGTANSINVTFEDAYEVGYIQDALWARANRINQAYHSLSFQSPAYRAGETRETALLVLRDALPLDGGVEELSHRDAIRIADAAKWAALQDELLTLSGAWLPVTDEMVLVLMDARRVLRAAVARHNPSYRAKFGDSA